MQIITLPRLVGTRESAHELSRDLPDDLSDEGVTLDARAVESAAQGFLDELVSQLLVTRNALSLIVVGAPTKARKHLSSSARIRSVADRLLFA